MCSRTCYRVRVRDFHILLNTDWIYEAFLYSRRSKIRTNVCMFLYMVHSEDQSVYLACQGEDILASPDNVPDWFEGQ